MTNSLPSSPNGAGAKLQRFRVGSVSEIVDEQRRTISHVGDHEILTLAVRGQIYAVSNVCTHSRGWLDPGEIYLDTLEIECPLHVGRFSLVTGEATLEPCEVAIRTYAVVVEGDDVYVQFAPVPDASTVSTAASGPNDAQP